MIPNQYARAGADLLHDLTVVPPRRSAAAEVLLDALVKPPRTHLTDADVRNMLELHCYYGFGYKRLAEKFECSVSCAQKICRGRRRTRVSTKSKARA